MCIMSRRKYEWRDVAMLMIGIRGNWVSAVTGAAEAAPREVGGCWLGLRLGKHQHLVWRLLS